MDEVHPAVSLGKAIQNTLIKYEAAEYFVAVLQSQAQGSVILHA